MTFETVIEKITKSEFQVEVKHPGENPQKCPICSEDRKAGNKNKKCFSYNPDLGVGHCQNCDARVYRKDENHKSYTRPDWTNKTNLPDAVVEWFAKRNINASVLTEMKISCEDVWMPQVSAKRKTICFNYFRSGILINTKYRDSEKNFKLHTGAELILYNFDGINGQKEIFITEGECDALVMIQAGFKNTCSVPNGANPKSNNLQYMDNCWQAFEQAEKVYIMTDNDAPGQMLADELARRIGTERCFRVIHDHKDVNDALNAGVKITREWIESKASYYPLVGVHEAANFWNNLLYIRDNGFPKGWRPRGKFGEKVCIHPGYMSLITGIPGHGKSEHLDQLVIELGIDYDLRGSYFSPENFPTEVHMIKLVEKILGRNFWELTKKEINESKEWINDHFNWIYPEDGFELKNILEHVRKAITRYGINWYVLDPWNKLDHQYTGQETTYISKCLDEIDNFNKKNNVHCFLVAHPTKMQKDDSGDYVVPNLYSINGSAHFFNKTALGWTVYKTGDGTTDVHVQKVKFKYWGEIGQVSLIWDKKTGRYFSVDPDYSNWLQTKDQNIKHYDEPEHEYNSERLPF